MVDEPSRNIGLDLLRVSESSAIAAGRWIGLGRVNEAHAAATTAVIQTLNEVDIDGQIVIGEESRLGQHSPIDTEQHVGTGKGSAVDVVVDPIDGTKLVVQGFPGAISLIGVAPRGTLWAPPTVAVYMEKIVVDRVAAKALVPECMTAPAAWTLALVARVKGKDVRDLTVVVLDRPRHEDLINEIRAAGARIRLRQEGDAEGAIEAALPGTGADILMGIGGVSEGIIAACAVRALDGGMLARLAPQSADEAQAIRETGFDPRQTLTCKQIVTDKNVYFAATGITHSPILDAIEYHGRYVETSSLLLRGETGTRRFIHTEHLI